MPLPQQTETPDMGDIFKQRASKACNRCRAKKARCSGGYPCSRCKSSDALCIFGYPEKSKRREFPEQYVRTLEMQQFKLVAGLQTMYFMLLDANSWPGPRLPENKGNPSVHDILDHLGLLDPENDRDIELEIGDIPDEQQTDPHEGSTVGSPGSSQQSFELLPQPGSGQSSVPPDCTTLQPQLLSSACDNSITIHPWQPQPVQFQPQPSFPQPLATDFVFGPQSYLDFWYQQDPRTLQDFTPTSVQFASETPDINTATDTNVLRIPTACVLSSYLVDPGVYACDFDVD